MELMEHQKEAIEQLSNGKVLYGQVGTGKTLTALGYYVKNESPKNILVFTTAKKRDSLEWEREAARLGIGDHEEATCHGIIEVDSYNKLPMYLHYENTFIIFDEQRLVGTGAWVKAFLKIVKNPGITWIMLSATPGDTWLDYAPLFIANGFYKNITDFKRKHVLYEPFMRYPKVRGYIGETKLELLRNEILVEMPFETPGTRYINDWPVGYDKAKFDLVRKRRWHIYEDRPLKDASEMFRVLRRVVNSDKSRYEAILDLLKMHPKLIIMYNFDYELEILRDLVFVTNVGELNGHRKDPIPEGDKWVYLVQYVAGAEAWNCIETNAMCLYSLTYSYKNFIQAQGRIDRMNSPFESLYYYVLVSDTIVDKGVRQALREKRNFNERKYVSQTIKL